MRNDTSNNTGNSCCARRCMTGRMQGRARQPSAVAGLCHALCLVLALAGAALYGPASANSKYAAIVIDANSGKTLFSRKADEFRYPASITKVMTLFIVFEALDEGRRTMESRVKITRRAAGQPPSKTTLKAGQTLSMRDAIMALITKSANDVAVALAENISGSEAAFVRRMNDTARQLGMTRTKFANPSGLPDTRQRSTARDIVRLAQAVQDRFPQYYGLFSTRSWRIGRYKYRNHNKLLGTISSVDGIKTGYIRASGFNLVSSAREGARRIIAVVLGGRSAASRDRHMGELIRSNLPKASRSARTRLLAGVSPHLRALHQAVATPRSNPLGASHAGARARLAHALPQPRPRRATDAIAITDSREASAPGGAETIAGLIAFAEHNDGPHTRSGPLASPNTGIPASAAVIEQGSSEPRPGPGQHTGHEPRISGQNSGGGQGQWSIRIGAAQSAEQALRLAMRAQAHLGMPDDTNVAARARHVRPAQTGEMTFYHAQIGKFVSHEAALRACAILRDHQFECVAINGV